MAALSAVVVPPAGAASALTITTSGANGVGRITTPGRSCADGGTGAYWHYGYESSLAAGLFSDLASALRMNLDVHRDIGVGSPGVPTTPTGFLQGTESTVTLRNERGTVTLRLSDGGDCETPTALVGPTGVQTTGDWSLDRGSGSYAGATGTGQFSVDAGIAPGADNPWTLDLSGTVTVRQPVLTVTAAGSYWGNLGADYLTRRPTVVFRVQNTGTGDAFGVRLTSVSSPTPGVTVLGPTTADLGDLAPGEAEEIAVRFQLGLTRPCRAVILACQFDVGVGTNRTDALGVALPETTTVRATAPILPPPL